MIPIRWLELAGMLLGALLTFALISPATLQAEPQSESGAPAELEPVPEPPDIPPRVESGETLEPDVTIIRGTKETITEYRVNGRLYAVRVEPGIGPGYWLMDADGDGLLERHSGLGPDFAIPGVVIFSW